MKTHFWFLLILTALFLCACAPAATPAASQPGMEVTNAVIMVNADASGMGMDQTYAGYLKIKNGTSTDDQLVGVTSEFADVMLHETTMNGDVASMKEISSIDLPGGGTVELKTGGVHIMFMNLKHDLKVGDTVNLILKFKNAGDVVVPAVVTAR
jgi:copper(I)-binding protein